MTFQIQYLYDFLNELHGNLPYLTQIELNDRALAAHSCITGMLSSLPPTSIILDYANSHFSYHFENMARYGNGHFSSGLSIYGLASNCSIRCVSTAAGVYALKQVVGAETYQYYFGSAVNHYNRLTTSTASAERPRLSLSHQEARFITLKLEVRKTLCMQKTQPVEPESLFI